MYFCLNSHLITFSTKLNPVLPQSLESILINTEYIKITQQDFLIRLLVASGTGFLIGLEREHSAMENKEISFAGIRTFIIISLAGFTGVLLDFLISPWIYALFTLAVICIIAIAYLNSGAKGDIGGTTEFTALMVFFLGSITLMGYIQISLVISVLILVVLSAKVRLHRMIGKITREEMYAIVRFVVAAIIILPFLPDVYTGPYNVINPREIGWVIVLTSGIGFLGYLLTKFLGHKKGILISGVIGGLVSSTMSTWVFAKKSRESNAFSSACAIAIFTASSMMLLRIVFWVSIFNKSLTNGLIMPVLLIIVGGASYGIYLYRKQSRTIILKEELPRGTALEFQSALIFGIIYIFILILVSFANEYAGESGILISGFIAGLSDIDAITISVSKLSVSGISESTALNAILTASISNTIVKIGIGIWAGSRELKLYLLKGFGLVLIAGLAGFLIINL